MDLLVKAGEAFNGYTEYATRVIADRRACPRDDLMSILVHAEVDGDRLDDDSILHESLLILIGGDETTRHVMSGGMYQLLVPTRAVAAAARGPRTHRSGRGGDAAVGDPHQEHGPHRHHAPSSSMARPSRPGRSCCCSTRPPTATKTASPTPTRSTSNGHRTITWRSDSARTSALGSSLARLELRALFDVLLDRLPDLRLVEATEPAHRAANFVSGYEGMQVAFTPTARRTPAD